MTIPDWLQEYLKLGADRREEFRLGSADVRKKVVADVTALIEKICLEERKVGLTDENRSVSVIAVIAEMNHRLTLYPDHLLVIPEPWPQRSFNLRSPEELDGPRGDVSEACR